MAVIHPDLDALGYPVALVSYGLDNASIKSRISNNADRTACRRHDHRAATDAHSHRHVC